MTTGKQDRHLFVPLQVFSLGGQTTKSPIELFLKDLKQTKRMVPLPVYQKELIVGVCVFDDFIFHSRLVVYKKREPCCLRYFQTGWTTRTGRPTRSRESLFKQFRYFW